MFLIYSFIKKYVRAHSVKSTARNPLETERKARAVFWNEKNLFAIHKAWYTPYAHQIYSMDLHHNKISELPETFFQSLPNLEDLDISENVLEVLPDKGLENCR